MAIAFLVCVVMYAVDAANRRRMCLKDSCQASKSSSSAVKNAACFSVFEVITSCSRISQLAHKLPQVPPRSFAMSIQVQYLSKAPKKLM